MGTPSNANWIVIGVHNISILRAITMSEQSEPANAVFPWVKGVWRASDKKTLLLSELMQAEIS
ncbi:MAG: hypothetical protein A2X11_10890 [Bacteroidetes bacterium GWE2_42_24]|nr:MAG: hypothetical protein A2X11_10890 [Bacteroidetes bacterium GWE2_42_24]OFY32053.1 MAG: hypothetical protein A2X09_10455 [Bacteroidetes bacterium GWF2_43_11]